MSYEPARDQSEVTQRLLKANCRTEANTANELARLRSEFGASHEQIEAQVVRGAARNDQALAGGLSMILDETCRQHSEDRSLLMEALALLREIRASMPKGYGSTGPYRCLPGQGLADPEDPKAVNHELRRRQELPEEW
ncbi:hypothetical protein [Cyanobium gracile]|uniref:hypothetical protein n=1 Tax=Cyanobium gracile TaxID=59930 RepID=UPI0012E9AF9B|nr:hypothetical protein [Cyanobium gracile]